MSVALYRAQRCARALIAEGIHPEEAIGVTALAHGVPVAAVGRFVHLALAGIQEARRAQAEAAERTAPLHERREREVEVA